MPRIVIHLDGPVAAALGAAFCGLVMRSALRASIAMPARPAEPEGPATLSLAEAAKLMGIGPRTLQQRSALGGPHHGLRVDNSTRHLLFSAARTKAFLEGQPSRVGPRIGRRP